MSTSRLSEVDDLIGDVHMPAGRPDSCLECVLHSVKETGIGNFKQEKKAMRDKGAALRCFAVRVRKL